VSQCATLILIWKFSDFDSAKLSITSIMRTLKLAYSSAGIHEKVGGSIMFLSIAHATPGGPALDIERGNLLPLWYLSEISFPVALNKLEKVALQSARRTSRPLVLIINNVHFFKNDDEGRNMILQLQQRAEAWAASGNYLSPVIFVPPANLKNLPQGILTLVFSS
jgi:hypothetical protein